MGCRASDCSVYSLQAPGRRPSVRCAADEEMTAADPGTMFSMLAGELEAAAGLYCLGLYTSLLCLGSAASAAL